MANARFKRCWPQTQQVHRLKFPEVCKAIIEPVNVIAPILTPIDISTKLETLMCHQK